MPPRHPSIAHALGLVRRRLAVLESPVGRADDEAGARRRIHVACSGGPDSIALLGLLHCMASRDRLALSVGHVDHGLRPESADEAAGVAEVARGLAIPFVCSRLSLHSGPGLPARARDARRLALRTQAQDQGARLVALGHTATDQAETMVLHLTRGAGLSGLSAMAEYDRWSCDDAVDEHAPGGWLRPLLDLDRDQTRALAQHLQLPFFDDPTNLDARHPRVRVRHEVLSVLRAINPRVEQALARSSQHARDAEQALAQWVDAELAARQRRFDPVRDEGPGIDCTQAHTDPTDRAGGSVTPGRRWSTEGWTQLPTAVRTRFVRRVCTAAGSPDDALSTRTVASIDEALCHPGPRRSWNLHPHLRLWAADRHLWIESQ